MKHSSRGVAGHANNLSLTRQLLEKKSEIRIVSIDLIEFGSDFVSSADYTPKNIEKSASLRDWIRHVVIENEDRVLWIDLKPHTDSFLNTFFFCGCASVASAKFDCVRLFRVLRALRKKFGYAIERRIWISCRDVEVYNRLISLNNSGYHHTKWMIIDNVPPPSQLVSSLMPLSLLPKRYAQQCVATYLRTHDFGNIVCVDHTLFEDTNQMIRFIEDSVIPRNALILIYPHVDKRERFLHIDGYHIVTQIEYKLKK